MENIVQIIKRPILTEKSSGSNEALPGAKAGRAKVVFEVSKCANKLQIQKAVEKLFSVKVDGVCTSIVPKKRKRVGRYIGIKAAWKKATVTLAEGNKIDFFEGA